MFVGLKVFSNNLEGKGNVLQGIKRALKSPLGLSSQCIKASHITSSTYSSKLEERECVVLKSHISLTLICTLSSVYDILFGLFLIILFNIKRQNLSTDFLAEIFNYSSWKKCLGFYDGLPF